MFLKSSDKFYSLILPLFLPSVKRKSYIKIYEITKKSKVEYQAAARVKRGP